MDEGHVYYPHDMLMDTAASLLEVNRDVLESLGDAVKQRRVVIDEHVEGKAV